MLAAFDDLRRALGLTTYWLQQVAQALARDARAVAALAILVVFHPPQKTRDVRCEMPGLRGQRLGEGRRFLLGEQVPLYRQYRKAICEPSPDALVLVAKTLPRVLHRSRMTVPEVGGEPVVAVEMARLELRALAGEPGEGDLRVASAARSVLEASQRAAVLLAHGAFEALAPGTQRAAQPPDGDAEVVQGFRVLGIVEPRRSLVGIPEKAQGHESHCLLRQAPEQVFGGLHGLR